MRVHMTGRGAILPLPTHWEGKIARPSARQRNGLCRFCGMNRPESRTGIEPHRFEATLGLPRKGRRGASSINSPGWSFSTRSKGRKDTESSKSSAVVSGIEGEGGVRPSGLIYSASAGTVRRRTFPGGGGSDRCPRDRTAAGRAPARRPLPWKAAQGCRKLPPQAEGPGAPKCGVAESVDLATDADCAQDAQRRR
jgi:hypothetical protein